MNAEMATILVVAGGSLIGTLAHLIKQGKIRIDIDRRVRKLEIKTDPHKPPCDNLKKIEERVRVTEIKAASAPDSTTFFKVGTQVSGLTSDIETLRGNVRGIGVDTRDMHDEMVGKMNELNDKLMGRMEELKREIDALISVVRGGNGKGRS